MFVALADPKLVLLGAMQSMFEGSMYTFVFLWTPALSPKGEHIPHGFIFACFMVASMIGSALAGQLMAIGRKPESYMKVVFAIAANALTVPVLLHFTKASSGTATGDIQTVHESE